MRDRPTFALRPLSLAITTLFRGSAALLNLGRFAPTPEAQRCLFGAPSRSSLPAVGSHGSGVLGQGSGRPRKWTIPWGNSAGTGRGKSESKDEHPKLTRTLKVLPDAAPDVDEPDCFRVMSFNVLAQPMASSKMFPYVPKNQLKKNNRGPRVRAEVCRYGADVICLQECDFFDETLAALQENKGSLFEGVYKRRNNSDNSHGVAILYDSKRFRLLESGTCDYGRYLFGGVGAFALLQDRRRRPPRPGPGETTEENGDVGGPIGTADGADRSGGQGSGSDAIAGEEGEGEGAGRSERWLGEALRPGAEASESGIFCVATSHLYWHPDGGAIRLAQAEVLMASVAVFLEERVGESYGSVPLVLAGDLNNVPGVDVYRLLSNGACKGGTPEAFYRRKRERARARKEQELEKARQAVALVAGIRARNAAAISASRRSSGDSGVGSEEGRSSSLSAPTIQGALHLTTPAAAVGLDEATRIGEAGAGGGGRGVAAAVAVAGAQEEAGGATGGGVGGGAVATAAGPVAPASVDYSPGGSGGDSKPSSELSGSNVSVDAPRDTPERAINKPDGDRDTDVRRYEQGFPGLSSAYGAYSSVFNSQLSKKRPPGESFVCEVTGQHTIGHVRLGARQAAGGKRGDGGGGGGGGGGSAPETSGRPAQETSGGAPELSRQHQLQHGGGGEGEEADRSMGEPQLTTCTDNFAGTIDYIWHTPQLQVRSLLDLPSLKQAMQGGGLPTTSYPSDHLSIMAELHWRRPSGDGPDAPTNQPR